MTKGLIYYTYYNTIQLLLTDSALFSHKLVILFGSVGCIIIRAVKVSALIYAINVAAINAIKYLNAVNATLFTSGVRCPLTRNRRVPT